MQLDRSASEGQVNQGTPPFWRGRLSNKQVCENPKLLYYGCLSKIEKDEAERSNGEA